MQCGTVCEQRITKQTEKRGPNNKKIESFAAYSLGTGALTGLSVAFDVGAGVVSLPVAFAFVGADVGALVAVSLPVGADVGALVGDSVVLDVGAPVGDSVAFEVVFCATTTKGLLENVCVVAAMAMIPSMGRGLGAARPWEDARLKTRSALA